MERKFHLYVYFGFSDAPPSEGGPGNGGRNAQDLHRGREDQHLRGTL